MAISPEEKIRLGLPLIRFMQSGLPLSVSRSLLAAGMRNIRLDAAKRETVSADGIRCDWVIPRNPREGQALLYLHGGGFVLGQTPLHLQMGAYLARGMSTRVLMVDYRLAPEHPYPAALEDCVTAYLWLRKQGFDPRRIAVAGDSAGGNLTITTMMRLRELGMPLPAAAACLSPVTDLTDRVKREEGFKDPLLPPKAVKFYTESYTGGCDPREPLISPVYGDLHGMPPILIHAGDDEILREDAVRITESAKAAGVEVSLEIYPRMWHVWQINLDLPQAVQSLDAIAEFLGTRIKLK